MEKLENNLLNIRSSDPAYGMYVRRVLKELGKRDPELGGLAAAVPQVPFIIGDSFFLHYSLSPMIRVTTNPDNVLEEFRVSMLDYSKSKDFRMARTVTALDEDMSLLLSYRFAEAFLKKLKEKVEEEARERGVDEDRVRQVLASLGAVMASGGGDQEGGAVGPQPSQGGQGQGELPDQSLPEDVADVVKSAVNELRGGLKDVVKKAFRKAREDVERVEDVREVFGGKGRGGGVGGTGAGSEAGGFEMLLSLSEMLRDADVREIIALGKKLSESLPRMVKRLRERGRRGEEVFGYYRTERLDRVIARELALPDDLFYARIASGGLLAREYASLFEGAYYVLVDKSGSMDGVKTVWARSVAVALFRLARLKGRKFFLRFFDAEVKELITDPLTAFETLVSVKSDGGTSIDAALERAVKDLRERRVKGTSTIIIITDGEDEVSFKPSELRAVNATLVAVMIRGDNESLRKLAEESGGEYMRVKPDEKGALRLLREVE